MELSTPRSSITRVFLGALAVLIAAVLLPLVQVNPAAASTSASAPVSVLPDGSDFSVSEISLPTATKTTDLVTVDGVVLLGSLVATSPVATPETPTPTVLGAPSLDAASPVVLGLPCWVTWVACVDEKPVRDVAAALGGPGVVCIVNFSDCAGKITEGIYNSVIKGFLKQLTNAFKNAMKAWIDFSINLVLKDELGAQGKIGKSTEPVVDCNTATGHARTICNASPDEGNWFLTEFSIMRQIGILMVVPLLMLLVIQSVLRGSLVFLVRAFTVMLPVAILGTVMAVTFTQILLNITDDICQALINNLTDIEGYGEKFKASIDGMSDDTFGLWGMVWGVVFMIAAFTIFVELMLREVGVYLATLFLPVAFAGLVWPSTARWARRLVQVLIGLVFSKMLIVAVLTLGMTAFSQSNLGRTNMADTQVVQQLSSGQQTPVEHGFASLFAGAALFLMAAFAPMRIFSLFEIERAGNAQPSTLMSKGQVASITLSTTNQVVGGYNTRRGFR